MLMGIGVLPLAITWSQLASTVGQLNLDISEPTFRLIQYFNPMHWVVTILKPGCMFAGSFYANWVVVILSPLLPMLFFGIYACVQCVVGKSSKRGSMVDVEASSTASSSESTAHHALQTVISAVSQLWMFLIIEIFTMFTCTTASDGVSRLASQPDVVCYTLEHTVWSFIAVVFGVLYGVLFPLKIYNLYRSTKGHSASETRARYPYLFRFASWAEYWELMVLLQKLGLAVSVTIIESVYGVSVALSFMVVVQTLYLTESTSKKPALKKHIGIVAKVANLALLFLFVGVHNHGSVAIADLEMFIQIYLIVALLALVGVAVGEVFARNKYESKVTPMTPSAMMSPMSPIVGTPISFDVVQALADKVE